MMSLGGSLLQVIVPLACAWAFYFQQDDRFGASVCVWWAGENLLDLAPYIDDARSLQLMLLGGPAAEVEGARLGSHPDGARLAPPRSHDRGVGMVPRRGSDARRPGLFVFRAAIFVGVEAHNLLSESIWNCCPLPSTLSRVTHMRIGIDLGGTKIEAIAIDGSNELLRRRVPVPRDDYAGTVAAVRDLVAAIEREVGTTGTVGIGIPGAISAVTGLVKNANSTWLIGQPLDRDLERALERPVRLMNDANCFALSEATDGAALGAHTVFGVILGTGTGAGIVVNGRVLEGRHRIAGEWGHNPLPWPEDGERPGPACYCGRAGCIETFLSGPGLSATYAAIAGRHAEAVEIARLAESGDPGADSASESTRTASRGRWRVSSMCSIRTSSCWAAACRTSPGCTPGCRRC